MPLYRYHCDMCGKTYIGPQIPGGVQCNCTPPKNLVGKMVAEAFTPLSPELTREVNISEATTLRTQLCLRWGIANKSHVQHGSNFSGNQKVVNLIHNIVDPVTGRLRDTVRAAIIRDYRYDIDSRQMTG
jgi:hypothetical protein